MGEDERLQRVWARRFDAWGEEWVELRSAVAPTADIPADAALAHNLDLPIGGLAQHGEVLVLVYKLALGPVSTEGVIAALQRVSMVADALEAKRGVDRY